MKRSVWITALMPILAAVVLGIVGCSTEPVKDTDIVATWGDTAMTVKQFKDWMYVRHRNEATAEKQPLDERYRIMNEYILRDIKILEGKRLGFDKRDDVQKSYTEAVERKAGDILYNKEILESYLTEDMIRDFWEHDKEELRCRHLLIKIDSVKGKPDTLAAYKKMQDVYAKFKAGENFISLVDQYGQDMSMDRNSRGDLGFFRWGRMVDEFERAAWKLKPGEVSAPVRTRYGYHLIQCVERRPTTLEVRTQHILVKVNRKSTPAETSIAYDRALTILKDAQKAGADFAQLARKYSEDENTWVNGDVGWIPRGSMPTEYWDLALSMDIGKVDGPVRTYKGYHIIKVTAKRTEPKGLDDKETRQNVISSLGRLHRDAIQKRMETYIEQVIKDFDMKYDDKVVKLLLVKLDDKNAPQNQNLFSSFTAEERSLKIVNDKLGGVTIQQLVDQYGDHRMPPKFENKPEWVHQMVEPICMPKYLMQIAKQKGYDRDPEVIADGKRTIENGILPEVEREMVFNKAVPTEEEIVSYYNKHPGKYTDSATAVMYEVQLADKATAQAVLKRVQDGEDFAKIARRETVRPDGKRKGGKLGPFKLNEYGPVSKKAFTMKPDEVAGPIQDGQNFSIIKLVSKGENRLKPLDEVRKEVENEVRYEKQKALQTAWEKELVRVYKFKLNKSVIKRVWPVLEQLPESMVNDRKKWTDERDEAARRKEVEDQIKMKVTPGQTQKVTTKDGRQIEVKFGEPIYKNKEGQDSVAAPKGKGKPAPKMKVKTNQ